MPRYRSPLTPKEARFIDEYMSNGFVGGKAAQAAGYSKVSARARSTELLRNPKIIEEIDKRKEKIAAKKAREGELPLDYLLSVMRDESQDMIVRLKAAQAAAPYVHPTLKSVEHRTQDGKPLVQKVIVEVVRGVAPKLLEVEARGIVSTRSQ